MVKKTIEIDPTVEARLDAAAEKRGLTVGGFVELLLEAWLREERFTAIRLAMEQATREAVEPEAAAGSDVELGVTAGAESR